LIRSQYAQAGDRLVRVHLPIGEKHDFKGVVDLISMKAYLGDGKAPGEIPADMLVPRRRPMASWWRRQPKARTHYWKSTWRLGHSPTRS
jgi:hypothetical protein